MGLHYMHSRVPVLLEEPRFQHGFHKALADPLLTTITLRNERSLDTPALSRNMGLLDFRLSLVET